MTAYRSRAETREFACVSTVEVAEARRAARAVAMDLGFTETAVEEIVIAVSELANNLLEHANGGELTLTPCPGDRAGIRIVARDHGPGIPDVGHALSDGFTTGPGPGRGLGSVNRFMDEFDIRARPGGGTIITCTRRITGNAPCTRRDALDVGVATRAYPGMECNGDAFVITRWDRYLLVGVIDGVGHGRQAHRAACAARTYIHAHRAQPMEGIFRGTGRACQGTRGVVMALARFDAGTGTLTFASVGNISVRVVGAARGNLRVRRGILGKGDPLPIVSRQDWDPRCLLILHSDGIPECWRRHEVPDLEQDAPVVIARRLLQRLARDDDDATVLVVGMPG